MLQVFMFSLYVRLVFGGSLEDLFSEWRQSLINEGRILFTSEHYSVQLDCASTVAGTRLLSSKVFSQMEVTWLIDDYEPIVSGADGRTFIHGVGKYRRSVLQINEVSPGDGGLYTCNLDKGRDDVENRFRTVTFFVLIPTLPPKFHQYISDSFNSSCPLDILYHTLSFAEADLTKWSVKWILNNRTVREGQLVNGSGLHFNYIEFVDKVHEGIWKCQVEHIGHFENGKTKRVYTLKLFQLKVHDLPSYIIRIPSYEILRLTTPFLGIMFTFIFSSHLILGIVLFDKFASIETKFHIWQVVNKFSKKNYMKFYLKELNKEMKNIPQESFKEEEIYGEIPQTV